MIGNEVAKSYIVIFASAAQSFKTSERRYQNFGLALRRNCIRVLSWRSQSVYRVTMVV